MNGFPSRTQHKVVRLAQVQKNGRKLIVPDTSVLLHDPESLFRFKDNDIFLCRQVLAQLDRHKKGQTDVGRNARQVARTLNLVFGGNRALMRDGAPLEEPSKGSATGRLFYQFGPLTHPIPKDTLDDDADRKIIGVACALRRERPQYEEVILVTKDINMRYAALGITNVPHGGILAEDYLYDRVLLKDEDVLPIGYYQLPDDFWDTHQEVSASKRGEHDVLYVKGPVAKEVRLNECVFIPNGQSYKVRELNGDTVVLESVTNFMAQKNSIWGVTARNREQNIALNHLTDPSIDLTILLGDAGTGKTFCALAAGFEYLARMNAHGARLEHAFPEHGRQTHHTRRHSARRDGGHEDHQEGARESTVGRIIVTRPMVPVGGEDLGFLPGDVKEKFGPWTAAIEDAQEALIANARSRQEWDKAAIDFREKIKIQPIGLIAGRTLAKSFIIVDEAQNLTPPQAKMLVTRVGEGTKIVVCGNLSQIDALYLDEKGSGLAYLVMRLRGEKHVAHVILSECVRSRLAALAVKLL